MQLDEVPYNREINASGRVSSSRPEIPMKSGRRLFLSNFAVLFAGAKALWAGGQGGMPTAGVPEIPDSSSRSSSPPDDLPSPPPPDPRIHLKESQKNLRRDADRLFDLAKDLKDEAYKTEQADVLSLSLVHKAEDVEKLARHIKDIVREA
jgi:hypothetical protein